MYYGKEFSADVASRAWERKFVCNLKGILFALRLQTKDIPLLHTRVRRSRKFVCRNRNSFAVQLAHYSLCSYRLKAFRCFTQGFDANNFSERIRNQIE